jgi:hypothetical protein
MKEFVGMRIADINNWGLKAKSARHTVSRSCFLDHYPFRQLMMSASALYTATANEQLNHIVPAKCKHQTLKQRWRSAMM